MADTTSKTFVENVNHVAELDNSLGYELVLRRSNIVLNENVTYSAVTEIRLFNRTTKVTETISVPSASVTANGLNTYLGQVKTALELAYPSCAMTHSVTQTVSALGTFNNAQLTVVLSGNDYYLRSINIKINEADGVQYDIDGQLTSPLEITPNLVSLNAGMFADINSVAANATNINAVAANEANIDAVAENLANVNTIASIQNLANMTTVANDLNAMDLNGIADVTIVANNLVLGAASSINIVSADKANIDAVAANKANIDAVAANESNINAVINSAAATAADVLLTHADVLLTHADVASSLVNANNSAASALASSESATASEASKVISATKAAEALSSATTSATKASESAASAVSSAASAATASAKSIEADASAASASSSAINAAGSASDALSSANTAASQAATATTKASEANTSALASASSATTASTQAGIATTKAGEAIASANASEASRIAAAGILDSFDDRYLGAKSSEPLLDNDGNTLLVGALYYNTTTYKLKIWTGSVWNPAAFDATGTVASFNTRTGAVTLLSSDVTTALGYTPEPADVTIVKEATTDTLTNKTIDDISNKVGANHIHYPVRNVSGSTIAAGAVVTAQGTQSGTDYVEVVPVTNPQTQIALGIMHTTVANNGTGLCMNTGVSADQVDTSGWAVGTILYPNNTGGLTSTKPTSGHYQACAVVLRSHANQGTLLVEFTEPKYIASTTQAGYVQLNDTLTSTSTVQALTAAQGKVLQDGKEPAFVKNTGFNKNFGTTAATVLEGNHYGSTGSSHGIASTSVNGFMSSADKTKLDGIAANANNYVHPTTDGNLHVPATSTTNNGKVLKAGATAGSIAWGTLTAADVGAAATSHTHTIADVTNLQTTLDAKAGTAVATTSVNGLMSSTDKTKLDGIASSAEVNQNAFSNIAVSGQTTVAADSKTDTLTLVAGTNVSITTDAVNDTITISANDTSVAFTEITGKPTTLAGYGITDAATSTHNHTLDALSNTTITTAANGHFLVWNGTAWVNRVIAASDVPSLDASKITTGTLTVGTSGNAATATKLATARTISLTGDATGSATFDGSANAAITVVIADDSHAHAFANIIAKPTTLAGYGITDAINVGQKGVANGVATLDSAGLIPTSQLPAYVDDVLEYANLAGFPATGESGKIYVALDTNKTYRWSGSTYIYITSGAVDSVNGQTGIVNITEISGNAGTATALKTARTIALTGDVTGSVSFNGTSNVSINATLVTTAANITALAV